MGLVELTVEADEVAIYHRHKGGVRGQDVPHSQRGVVVEFKSEPAAIYAANSTAAISSILVGGDLDDGLGDGVTELLVRELCVR